jgi:DNA-binding NtrC family response regulator
VNKTKVLVVDDEVEFASTLAERLQLRGYDAKSVYCAEDTFAVVKGEPPDVILLDLKMPGMSGIEILMTVRTFAPDIYVILLTGHMDVENKIEGISLDNFDYIMKPVDIKELIQKIEDAVRQRKD